MTYLITLISDNTGKSFAYRYEPNITKALILAELYNKFHGVSVKMVEAEHA